MFYRKGGNPWVQLDPNADSSVYTHQELAFAIGFMAQNPFVEGICVRLGDDVFNIMLAAGHVEKVFTFQKKKILEV
jgi:hypothetical protein